MIRPEVKNVEQVRSQVDRWLAKVRKEAEDTARGLGSELVTRLIQSSPQWSGDFASNWRYSLNTVDMSYDTGDIAPRSDQVQPWQQFDRPAVQLGLMKNRGKDASFKLGDTIFISNSSTHDNVYAKAVFDGSVKLRDVNRKVLLTDVVAEFNREYGAKLDNLTASQLRRKRI